MEISQYFVVFSEYLNFRNSRDLTFRYCIQKRLILLFTGTIVSPAAVRRVNDGPHNTSTPKNNTTTVISSSEADLQPETPKSDGKKGRKTARKSISVVSPAVNVSTYY